MQFGKFKLAAVALGMAAGLGAPASVDAASLTIGDAYYLGYINDGIPSSEALESTYVNSLLALSAGAAPAPCTLAAGEICDRVGSTLNVAGLPSAVAAGAVKNETGSFTGIDVTGWTYILAKYDGPNFGEVAWYVGNLNEVIDIPGVAGANGGKGKGANGYGISHFTLFNFNDPGPDPDPVPEPTTMALFGLGLLGAGVARRRARK